ncbi:hypothetical protein [Aegicerativicinus sediminis]|uniref:hypothetical protein n=1 Tax=Aegicerativicinus sediminis TaxID=2893202 RepID=UPI001E33AFE2|nr:hypothetical protein [Aegicerativicinus sediminis]
MYVDVKIDPGKSDISYTDLGQNRWKVTLIPKDAFGNHFGPGRANELDIKGNAETELTSSISDNLDGSYTFEVSSEKTPEIVVNQPGTEPTVWCKPCHEKDTNKFNNWLLWLLILLIIILFLLVLFT